VVVFVQLSNLLVLSLQSLHLQDTISVCGQLLFIALIFSLELLEAGVDGLVEAHFAHVKPI
jgi:hypothetical protein